MEYVKPKVHDETNYYQGVDLNDKKAVQKEFRKRRAAHTFVTLIMIAMFAGLGVIAFDYFRVLKLGGRPLFATSEVVSGGKLYKGIGYQVLYCDDDKRYIGSVLYQTCNDEKKDGSFKQVLHDSLVRFAEDKNIIDKKNFVSLTINEYTFDEENEKEGSDYLIDVSVECKDGSKCFKTTKEMQDPNNFKLILRIDKYTSVYDIVYFKTSGAYYDSLVEKYKEKIKQYFIDNNMIAVDNLRSFNIGFAKSNGKVKFRDVVYADSYLISISYLCKDGNNTCVSPFDKKDFEGDYSNMYFFASMFVDENENVSLIGPREYLDL